MVAFSEWNSTHFQALIALFSNYKQHEITIFHKGFVGFIIGIYRDNN